MWPIKSPKLTENRQESPQNSLKMPVTHYFLIMVAAVAAVKLTTLTFVTLGAWTWAFFAGYNYTSKKKNYTSSLIANLGVLVLGGWDIYRRNADVNNTTGIWGPLLATLLGAGTTALAGAAANTIF